eukprot:966043-Prorocentrum_minimum.AAC.1
MPRHVGARRVVLVLQLVAETMRRTCLERDPRERGHAQRGDGDGAPTATADAPRGDAAVAGAHLLGRRPYAHRHFAAGVAYDALQGHGRDHARQQRLHVPGKQTPRSPNKPIPPNKPK